MDYFSLFGLPIEYKINAQTLISRFQDLQRKYHPDKFSNSSRRERLNAEQQSAMINQAWQTLRNPIGRAEYLISLNNFNTKNHCHKMCDTTFLMEQFSLREEMDAIDKKKDYVRLEEFIERVQKIFTLLCQKIETELDKKDWESALNTVYKLRFLDELRRSSERLEEKMFDL